MKTMKVFKTLVILAIVAVSLIFPLSNCNTPEPEIITETVYVNGPVHDTLTGKTISGLCSYPDFTNTVAPAAGAALSLYVGTAATGTPVVTTFADLSGNYSFKYLLPGSYFVTAVYNTEHQNKYLSGINFAFEGIVVTMATSNVTQDVLLASAASQGLVKIMIDSSTAGDAGYRKVVAESHSNFPWTGLYNQTQQKQDLPGGFNAFNFDQFIFNEATPANIAINVWVQTSSINTFQPARDAIGGGYVSKTLDSDTTKVGGVIAPIPATDTIRFYANAGEVIKYGKGYLAHGHMRGFYEYAYGTTDSGAWASTDLIPEDTRYLQTEPYGTTIDKPVDMYFEYVSKIKQGTTRFKWMFTFEGRFTINKLTGWYVKSTSISDLNYVEPHITMHGSANIEY